MPNYFNDLSDVGDDDLVGWNPFSRKKRKMIRQGAQRTSSARRLIPRVPGVPARGLGEQPLGFGSTAFTSLSGTILTLTAQPQRPFRGRRLVVDISRTPLATGLITITRLDVGVDNQLPGSGAIGAGTFAATAFGVDLDMDPATPGVNIVVQFAISAAPAVGERVDVAATLIGEAVR